MKPYKTIGGVLGEIKNELDSKLEGKPKKISLVHACNASGKTRMSKLFYQYFKKEVLYYNAFTEDLFKWDNKIFKETHTLNIDKNKWIFDMIEKQGLYDEITKNFQRFTGSRIIPVINIPLNKITFRIYSDSDSFETVKISRGEESIFIWSIFYTILEEAIGVLNEKEPSNRATRDFNNIKYVIIDDPVSSMDDARIIAVALGLTRLIATSKSELKFLITTHHALFFNVLFDAYKKKSGKKAYILSKLSFPEAYFLKKQSNESPFAYHHAIISDIEEAIKNNDIKRYHFNIFRTLLEKTANFLGYSQSWSKLLAKEYRNKEFVKHLNHYSHSRLSDLEPKDLPEDDKKDFEKAFKSFITDFRWYENYDDMKMMTDSTYSTIMENGKSTVVYEHIPEKRNSTHYQTEAELEKEFVNQLVAIGYERLDIKNNDELLENLRTQLSKFNDYEFSDKEWEQMLRKHLVNKNESIKEKTARIQRDGYILDIKTDDGRTKNIHIIDKQTPCRNIVQVINQYEAEGTRQNRYDVTILVNGLPMVHIELKRRGVSIREAFNQIKRYQRDSFWADSGLFEYIQLFVVSNGTNTKYYSNTTRDKHLNEQKGNRKQKKTSNSFEFTCWWADAKNNRIADIVDFTNTFFAKRSLLYILTRYCVFTSDNELLVMRPYQIVAAERIINCIRMTTNHEMLGSIQAGGYIWHTTGSGKTLTSFKTAQIAKNLESVEKVLFIVDRKDLDYQTMKEYDKFEKGAANSNADTKILTDQLSDTKSKIIITTIQKLSIFIKQNKGHEVFNKHVVLIFDECHRSQFGEMHEAIVKKFKKYNIFGFTGTPIFAENSSVAGKPTLKTTEQAFGTKLHAYTIVDAINDENVLPFKAEYHQTMHSKSDIKDKKVSGIDTKAAYLAPKRIALVTDHIIEHFNQKTKRDAGGGYTFSKLENIAEVVADKERGPDRIKEEKTEARLKGFNSIFAVGSIDLAKAYYEEFKARKTRLKVATIFSYAANEEEEDAILDDEDFDTSQLDRTSRDFLDDVIKDYNKMFKTSYDTGSKFENYYKDISQRMKNREIDMLIVVNMFLTGFDATTLNTLWVDKNLKHHGLIQAFSRTNRILNSVKKFGNIVCFRELEEKTNQAIAMFGDEDAGGIVLLKSFDQYYNGWDKDGKHQKGYVELIDALKTKFAMPENIVSEKDEKDFIALWGAILRRRNILTAFDEFADKEILSERDFQDYQSAYIDLYEKIRKGEDAEKENINDDIEFEMELVKQVTINIDYILYLIAKYNKTKDPEVLEDIFRIIDANLELRSKRELIEKFIKNLNDKTDVHADWQGFAEENKTEDLKKIIQEENLKPEETEKFMANAFRNEELKSTGIQFANILPPISMFDRNNPRAEKKKAVLKKLIKFFEKYLGI